MGALANLVPKCQPALANAGAIAGGAVGASWYWKVIDVTDINDNPVDLSGCTGVCKIIDLNDAVVATLTVAGANDGSFTMKLDETVTAAITPAGTYLDPVTCRFFLTFADGTDIVQIWHPVNSYFYIYKGA